MTQPILQPSFAAGELSPAIAGRVDLSKYKIGLATGRNFFVDYRGGVSTRAGTRYMQTSATPGTGLPPRLIRFQFSDKQNYVLEFGVTAGGAGYIGFYANGGVIMSGSSPYTISSPYALADLQLLKFTQSADVLTFTHPKYPTYQLQRYGDNYWVLAALTIGPTQLFPTGGTVTPHWSTETAATGDIASTIYNYVVTAVSASGEESRASASFSNTSGSRMMSLDGDVYQSLTWTAPAGVTPISYNVYRQAEIPNGSAPAGALYGLIGSTTSTSFNDRNGSPDFSITPPQGSNPFAVLTTGAFASVSVTGGGSGYSSSAYLAMTSSAGSGAILLPVFANGVLVNVQILTPGASYAGVTLTIVDPASGGTTPTGAVTFSGQFSGTPGAGGSGAGATATLVSSGTSGANYPGCTAYYGQRQWFAETVAQPQTFWCSKTGSFLNFDASLPVRPDDAITDTLASTQVNRITALVPMPSGLIMFSSGGAWQITGGGVASGGTPTAITSTNITATPQAYNGAADVPPIVIGQEVLFVQAKGSIVRDLSYNYYVNIYTGTDLTVLSNHLFINRKIKEWAYVEEPFKVVWAVQETGSLLSLTYLKEQDVYGWMRHDTNGLFQSVCAVSEPPYDNIYFVVKRLLAGGWTYTIERMEQRAKIDGDPTLGIAANIEQAWCVDCGLSLTQPVPAANLSIGTGADVIGTSVQITADAAVFSAGNVGAVIRANGGKATITAYSSSTVVTATVTQTFVLMPNDPTKTPVPATSGNWTMTQPVTVLSGLSHLNGKTVSILADGNVVAPQMVSSGQITLQQAASSVVVGLPFQAQMQTCRIDVGEPTVQGKRKKINAVTVRVKDTRGLKIGRMPATVSIIKEWNSTISMGGPLPLVSGDERVIVDPVYDTGGQFWIQIDDPVPATVLAVMPEITLGDT